MTVGKEPARFGGALLAAVVLVAALFPRAVFLGEAFYERDIQYDWYTQVEAFVRSIAQGSWPLWDNSISFGQPLLADPSAQVLYPPTWLNLIVLPATYYTVFVTGHLVFSNLGLYRLGRRLGLSGSASLLAAAFWTASGPLLSLINVWHHFAGVSWLPWVLLAAEDALAAGGGTAALLRWAAVSAGQLLAGSADMAALTHLLAGLLALRHVPWARPQRALLRLAGSAIAGIVLAVGLSAAQWIPTVETTLRSSRMELPATVRNAFAVHPWILLQGLVPVRLHELPLEASVRTRLFDSGEPFLPSLYLGLSGIVFVVAGLSQGGRVGHCLGLAGGLGVLVALGHHTPLYGLLTVLAPPLRLFRYPSKAMVLPALCWALLAGMGLDAARRASTDRIPRPGALALHGLAIVGALSAWFFAQPGRLLTHFLAPVAGMLPSPEEVMRLASRRVLVSALLSILVLGLLSAGLGATRGGLALAAAFTVADLVTAHVDLNATAPSPLLTYRPAFVSALGPAEDHSRVYVYEYERCNSKARERLGRDDPYGIRVPPGMPVRTAQVLSQRSYPFPPSAARWGFEGSYECDVRGLYSRPLAQLTRVPAEAEGTPLLVHLLRLGAVSRVVALHDPAAPGLTEIAALPSLFAAPIRVFAVPGASPRSFVVGSVRQADGAAALRALCDPAFDPAREVILPDTTSQTLASFTGASRILSFRPDRVSLEVVASAQGHAVLVDTYDQGWRASVDGQEAPVLRANLAFRAVPIPAGRHRVDLVYRPASVRLGCGVSLFTLLAMTIVALRRFRQAGPAGTAAPSEGGGTA